MSVRRYTAAEFRDAMLARFGERSYADVGRDLGLSDEFVRQVLTGLREPSRAFLDAVGYERVVLYRKKA